MLETLRFKEEGSARKHDDDRGDEGDVMETQTKYRSKRESLKAVTLIVKPVMAVVKSHLSHLSLTLPKGAKEL